MSERGKAAMREKFTSDLVSLREQCFPGCPEDELWGTKGKKPKGWIPFPRVMPYLLVGLDSIEGVGILSMTYLALWARMNEGFVCIKNEHELAVESGFVGQRAVLTWRSKMKCLIELKAIVAQEGSYGEYSFVLVRNPYKILKEIENKMRKGLFLNAVQRAQEVGAESEFSGGR